MSDEPLSYVELSDEPITDAELAELGRLAEAATPGPWKRCGCGHCGAVFTADGQAYVHIDPSSSVDPYTNKPNEDAAFIAASRSAVPRLLAALAASDARYAAALAAGEQAQLAAEAAVALLGKAVLFVRYAKFDAGYQKDGNSYVMSRKEVLAAIDAFLAERAAR